MLLKRLRSEWKTEQELVFYLIPYRFLKGSLTLYSCSRAGASLVTCMEHTSLWSPHFYAHLPKRNMSATLITSCLYWLHPPPPVVPHPPVFVFSAHIEPVRNREDKVYGLALNVNDFQIIWGNRKHSTVTNCSRSADKINLCIVMHVDSILFCLCWCYFNNLAQLFKHYKKAEISGLHWLE